MESESALEHYLRTAPYHYVRDLEGGGGHQDKKLLILRGAVAVAAKPGHDQRYASQARSEVAGWRLAAELELTRLVPTTVLRQVPAPDGGDILGSAQVIWAQFVKAEQNFRHTDCADDIAWKVAVFDLLAANTDRNDGNWGAIRLPNTPFGDPVLIDHGHCFGRGATTTSPFFQDRHGKDIPAHALAHVHAFLATASNSRLHEVLDVPVVNEVIARAKKLVQDGKLQLP